MLAVVTFVFGVTAQLYLYRQPLLSGDATSLVSFPRGTLFGIDLSSQRAYYWACAGGAGRGRCVREPPPPFGDRADDHRGA